MNFINIIILLIIVLIICEIYHNNQRIYINLRSLIGKSDRSSMPLHKCNLQILIKYLFNDNTIYDSFIDFGCGEGNVIVEIAKLKKYMKIIGIEISSISYKIALKKCINYPNIKIINMSMTEWIFENVPTILFLYEPLWIINDKILKKNIGLKAGNIYLIANK